MKSHKRVTYSDVLNWTKEAKLDLPDRWERIQYNLPQHPKQNIAENDIGLKSIYPKMSRKKLLIACAVFAVLILIGGLLVSGQSGLWFQPSNNSDNHTSQAKIEIQFNSGQFSFPALSINELLEKDPIIIKGVVTGQKKAKILSGSNGTINAIYTPVTIRITEVIASGRHNLGKEIDCIELGGATDQYYMKSPYISLNISDEVLVIMDKKGNPFGPHNVYIIGDDNTVNVYKFLFPGKYKPDEMQSIVKLDVDDFVDMIKQSMN